MVPVGESGRPRHFASGAELPVVGRNSAHAIGIEFARWAGARLPRMAAWSWIQTQLSVLSDP